MADTELNEEDMNQRSERDQKILRSHAAQLMEHFDSVQIVVTRFDSDVQQTFKGNQGCGNWYANFGAVKEWLEEQNERIKVHIRNEE